MSKHTPWKTQLIGHTGFAGGYDVYSVVDQAGHHIVDGGLDKETADMIAAAPELLEALLMIISALPQNRDWLDPYNESFARRAITKATGEK